MDETDFITAKNYSLPPGFKTYVETVPADALDDRGTEWRDYLTNLEPVEITVECDKGFCERLWNSAQIAFARKEFNPLLWRAYWQKFPESWANAENFLPPQALKDFRSYPDSVQTIVTSPQEIVRGSKISVFCVYARGWTPESWFLNGWFIVPKRKATKTARLLQKTFARRDYLRHAKILNRFQIWSASEKDAFFLKRQDD
jgi:hypothetical protein